MKKNLEKIKKEILEELNELEINKFEDIEIYIEYYKKHSLEEDDEPEIKFKITFKDNKKISEKEIFNIEKHMEEFLKEKYNIKTIEKIEGIYDFNSFKEKKTKNKI